MVGAKIPTLGTPWLATAAAATAFETTIGKGHQAAQERKGHQDVADRPAKECSVTGRHRRGIHAPVHAPAFGDPGDAQHEITVAFRENPGAHGAGSHSSPAAPLA